MNTQWVGLGLHLDPEAKEAFEAEASRRPEHVFTADMQECADDFFYPCRSRFAWPFKRLWRPEDCCWGCNRKLQELSCPPLRVASKKRRSSR